MPFQTFSPSGCRDTHWHLGKGLDENVARFTSVGCENPYALSNRNFSPKQKLQKGHGCHVKRQKKEGSFNISRYAYPTLMKPFCLPPFTT